MLHFCSTESKCFFLSLICLLNSNHFLLLCSCKQLYPITVCGSQLWAPIFQTRSATLLPKYSELCFGFCQFFEQLAHRGDQRSWVCDMDAYFSVFVVNVSPSDIPEILVHSLPLSHHCLNFCWKKLYCDASPYRYLFSLFIVSEF